MFDLKKIPYGNSTTKAGGSMLQWGTATILLILFFTSLHHIASAQQASERIADKLAGEWVFQRAELAEKQAGSQIYSVVRTFDKVEDLQLVAGCYGQSLKRLFVWSDRDVEVETLEGSYSHAQYQILDDGSKVHLEIMVSAKKNDMGQEGVQSMDTSGIYISYRISMEGTDTIKVTTEAFCQDNSGALVQGAVTCTLKRTSKQI